MARKDVDLVIRAKDEAAKVVDSITAALNEFVGAQENLSKSAGKTDSTLGALGAALGNLDKQLRGMSAAGRVSQEFDKATAATTRLKSEFIETQQHAAKLASELKKAEFATDRLTAKASGAAAAQSKQAAALERAKKSQADLNVALAKATGERDKLAAAETRLTTAITKQQAKVAEVTERYNRLAGEIAATAAPTKSMQARLESANTSLQKQSSRLEELRGKYAATQGDIAKTATAIGTLGPKVEQANTAVARQEQVLAKITANYRELQTAAKSAGRNQATIAEAADRTADALGRQNERINRSETELAQFAAAAGKAGAAMSELAGRSGAALQASFDRQRRTMLEAKRSWVELTQEAGRLAAEIARVGVPTQKMVEAFQRAKTAAGAAKQEYVEQRNGLHQLSGVLRQTGTSVDALRAKQAAFVEIQARTGAAITRIRTEAAQTATSYNLLSTNATRAATAVRATGQAAQQAASGASNARVKVEGLAQAYRRLYGESRTAMSWTQRLRGEVLSLIAAYAGIYGVINLLNRTVQAYVKLEAAQNRLGVVFAQDLRRTGDELDWVRRNADRLGIPISILADEYSKFAVAAQAANFESESTRRIFLAVAEAARVNKNSTQEMSGIFLALTQIISKGKVTSEELRRQLGDRLAGAFNIFADAIGVTTAELDAMMQQGEVIATEGTLLKFADELTERFGPQLATALKSTTTQIGRFENAAFQALVVFGNGGFIESFTNLLKDLTETLQSADFQDFTTKISKGFGLLADTLGLAIRNFDLVVIAAAAFAGIKLTPLVVALGGAFLGLGTRVSRVGTIMVATRNTMIATAATTSGMAGAFGVATTAIRGMTLAMRALLSSTGIGLLVTAVTVGIGLWATHASDATEAMVTHRAIVDKVKNAYDQVGTATKDWAAELRKTTLLQAVASLDAVRKAAAEARKALQLQIDVSGTARNANQPGLVRDQITELRELAIQYRDTGGDVDEFKAKVAAIGDVAANDFVERLALSLLNAADGTREWQDALATAEAVIRVLKDEATDADRSLLGMSESTGAAGDAARTAAEKSEEFHKALSAINDILPEIGHGLDDLKRKAEIDEAFQSASRAAQSVSELAAAVDAANAAYDRLAADQVGKEFGKITDGVEASVAVLRHFEGFIGTPEFDTTRDRIGFGSDTITLSDQTVKEVTAGMRVSVEDALRDLNRRIGETMDALRKAVGGETFDKLTAQQQAALVSITYNYGSGELRSGGDLGSVVEAVRSGTVADVAAAIKARGGDNGGLNRDRRNQEAALFSSQAGVESQVEALQKEAEDAEKKRLATEATILAQQQEIEQQRLINDGKAREAEIEKEIAAAIKENPAITDDEIDQIRKQTGALFDLKQVKKDDVSQQKEAEAVMQRINALIAQRTALETAATAAQKAGDTTKYQETQTAIAEVNTQLDEAIAKARTMWEAIGGAAADTALIKLDTAALKASNLADKAQQNYLDWNRVANLFASGLTSAFQSFAQAVAEGKDIGEAARDAFLKFASDFLLQIAQMIIQQAILNALKMAFGGFGGGGIGVGIAHAGGIAGSLTRHRTVDPGVFAGAPRFHGGGIPGLKPGEVPAILQRREEVLTADDPRHALNGGLAPAAGQQVAAGDTKIINAFDTASFLEEALRGKVGEKAILNFVRANAGAMKQALNG